MNSGSPSAMMPETPFILRGARGMKPEVRSLVRDDFILLTREVGRAYRIALTICRNPGLAEESVQVAFTKLLKNPPRYQGYDGLVLYLFKVVRGTVLELIRQEARRRKREDTYAVVQNDDGKSTDADLERAELISHARKVLSTLPIEEREAVTLCCELNLNWRQAAELAGTNQRTIGYRVRRGLDKLKAKLTERGFSETTAVAIGSALEESGVPAAPESLSQSVLKMKTGLAADYGAAGSVQAAVVGPWLLITGALILCTSAGAGWIFLKDRPKENHTSEPIVAPEGPVAPAFQTTNKSQPFRLQIDFNSPEIMDQFETNMGEWTWKKTGGPDGSAFFETNSKYCVLVLKIPVPKLPLRISFQARPRRPSILDQHYIGFSWSHHKEGARFLNAGKMTGALHDNMGWWSHSTFVSDRFLVNHTNQTMTSITYLLPAKEGKLILVTRGRYSVDNLLIEQIDSRMFPDVTPYAKVIDSIPPEQRRGTHLVPQLKPQRPTGPVQLVFEDAVQESKSAP